MEQLYSAYQHQSAHFQPDQLKKCSLSLFVSRPVLAYAVLSPEGKIVALREYRTKSVMEVQDLLEEAVAQDYFLKEDFASVNIISGIMEFTIMPQPHFDESRRKELAEALIKDNTELDHIEVCHLGHHEAVAVYSLPIALRESILKHFPSATFAPFCKTAVEMALALSGEAGNLILIHVTDNEFVLTGIRDHKLHICNAYPWHAPSDIVFFVQLAAELMQLGDTPCEVLLTGCFETGSDLDRGLKQHVPGIRIPLEELKQSFDGQSEKIPVWKYAFLSYH